MKCEVENRRYTGVFQDLRQSNLQNFHLSGVMGLTPVSQNHYDGGIVYMFIGRERELGTLNRLYSSERFEFVAIYGRRRVGKTALINEFIGEKKAIYFMGVM